MSFDFTPAGLSTGPRPEEPSIFPQLKCCIFFDKSYAPIYHSDPHKSLISCDQVLKGMCSRRYKESLLKCLESHGAKVGDLLFRLDAAAQIKTKSGWTMIYDLKDLEPIQLAMPIGEESWLYYDMNPAPDPTTCCPCCR